MSPKEKNTKRKRSEEEEEDEEEERKPKRTEESEDEESDDEKPMSRKASKSKKDESDDEEAEEDDDEEDEEGNSWTKTGSRLRKCANLPLYLKEHFLQFFTPRINKLLEIRNQQDKIVNAKYKDSEFAPWYDPDNEDEGNVTVVLTVVKSARPPVTVPIRVIFKSMCPKLKLWELEDTPKNLEYAFEYINWQFVNGKFRCTEKEFLERRFTNDLHKINQWICQSDGDSDKIPKHSTMKSKSYLTIMNSKKNEFMDNLQVLERKADEWMSKLELKKKKKKGAAGGGKKSGKKIEMEIEDDDGNGFTSAKSRMSYFVDAHKFPLGFFIHPEELLYLTKQAKSSSGGDQNDGDDDDSSKGSKKKKRDQDDDDSDNEEQEEPEEKPRKKSQASEHSDAKNKSSSKNKKKKSADLFEDEGMTPELSKFLNNLGEKVAWLCEKLTFIDLEVESLIGLKRKAEEEDSEERVSKKRLLETEQKLDDMKKIVEEKIESCNKASTELVKNSLDKLEKMIINDTQKSEFGVYVPQVNNSVTVQPAAYDPAYIDMSNYMTDSVMPDCSNFLAGDYSPWPEPANQTVVGPVS